MRQPTHPRASRLDRLGVFISFFMDAAQTIRNAVARVSALRHESETNPALRAAITEVKQFQARRFAHTYSDLLDSDSQAGTSTDSYKRAARFFLDELYSDKDYTLRDIQFSRISGALQKFFPIQVTATAVSLAQLHALTEALDHAMGIAWLVAGNAGGKTAAQRYASVWRNVDRREDRNAQLYTVLAIGQALDKLTRTPGLRLMLKMMRRPAHAAGLSSLQSFLEAGFDTFARMSAGGKGTTEFLSMVHQRESNLIDLLFSS